MQQRVESYLRAINNQDLSYNVLKAPTHERYESNWATMPHNFYMFWAKGIKGWNEKFAQMPKNHIMLDGTIGQIKSDMKFDMVLSQNKFGQYQYLSQLAQQMNLPLISLEHTLPMKEWGLKRREMLLSMRGKINIFISKYSIKEWGFDINDPSVRIIEHCINSEIFKPLDNSPKDGRILTVANDYVNRDYFLGFGIYKRICIDGNLPVNPVGDTKGFSEAAKDLPDLVSKYQKASVFFNTSTISPVPTSLLEAMSAGLTCISTATCMIPDIIEDGVNGFISNDEAYLKDRLIWCLKNEDKAKEIGQKARETIVKRFSLERHIRSWMDVFNEVYGKGN